MREGSPNKFLEQLRVLVRHEIDFIVVGGVAAVFEGAPIVTLDLDIVYERSPQNLRNLVDALREMNALYNDPAGRRIEPDSTKLETSRIHLLVTELGGLDVLQSIGDDLRYEDLVERSTEYEIADMRLTVLNLEAIVESKEFADRDKDRAVLPILRRTLEIKDRGRSREQRS